LSPTGTTHNNFIEEGITNEAFLDNVANIVFALTCAVVICVLVMAARGVFFTFKAFNDTRHNFMEGGELATSDYNTTDGGIFKGKNIQENFEKSDSDSDDLDDKKKPPVTDYLSYIGEKTAELAR
jgi:hypothetical protein